MKHAVLGILAHVDAGKTTLSEALLHKSGIIKTPGRVDHKSSFLDNNSLEKERGITIFSKQAVFAAGDFSVTLLDTPGHMDFSAEMERTLHVLDCAILLISAPDGVQAHTETLWRLLKLHNIPTIVWVNKMDRCEKSAKELCRDLSAHFGPGFCDYMKLDHEDAAALDEDAIEEYFEAGRLSEGTLRRMMAERKLFPCFFGSALKLSGVDEFLEALPKLITVPSYPDEFGAAVFKITRSEDGKRLTWLKISGGKLKNRCELGHEKINQIRIYNGRKFEAVDEAAPGQVVAVCGLSESFAGQGLGAQSASALPLLEPVLSYRIMPPEGMDAMELLGKLKALAEEDPMLRIVWNPELEEIQVQLMGEVQTEILKTLIAERFGCEVEIGKGSIMYRETIAEPITGKGHFEPLRHYAEVHVLLEPLPSGEGLIFESAISTDTLSASWQRMIVAALEDTRHKGVLTGSPLTDVKLTLIAGRAHLKHTDGGDFRQAASRAVRQGLMKAQNVLLEPYYNFVLEVPTEHIGRAMSDLRAMHAKPDAPRTLSKSSIITGAAPVSTMQGYLNEVLAYTRGLGHISCTYGGYYPCHNTKAVVEASAYDPERDVANSPDSVFCSHGSGLIVKWDICESFMHLESNVSFGENAAPVLKEAKLKTGNISFDDKELEAIMEREFGPIKRPKYSSKAYDSEELKPKQAELKKDYLIVDGYNVIFAWKELKELAGESLQAAAAALINVLANYKAFTGTELVLVFDGYKVKENPGSKDEDSGLHIVYTKEGQSADAYIEKLSAEIGKNYNVKIVSSDGMIQLAALKSGTLRVSALEFKGAVTDALKEIALIIKRTRQNDAFRNPVIRS